MTAMTKRQRDKVAEAARQLAAVAGNRESRPSDVIRLLDATAKTVTGFSLGEFRRRALCPDCLEAFTSGAAMRSHWFVNATTWRRECLDPAALPGLALKSGGRWGWSDAAKAEFEKRQGEMTERSP